MDVQLRGTPMTHVRITHIGGPTVLIEFGGWRILTDPTFDPPGATYDFGWGTRSRKTTGPAIDLEALGPVDAVLLSHDHHADNLDEAGRTVLAGARVVVTNRSAARRLGGGARGLRPWETTRLEAAGRAPIDVTATPCRHGPPLSGPIVGDVVGFALRWDTQEQGQLWISGDTVLYDGVREVADRIDVDIAVLHLGGARFPLTGPVRYSMTVADAIALCRQLRPRLMLPVHYEGWSHFGEGRAEIERALTGLSLEERRSYRLLPLGTGVDIRG